MSRSRVLSPHLQGQDGAVDADRVADLDGAREGRLRLHRLEVVPTLRRARCRAQAASAPLLVPEIVSCMLTADGAEVARTGT